MCLGSILEALGGVLEALEGVLKASWRRLGDQHEPRCKKIEKSTNNIENTQEIQRFWPTEVGGYARCPAPPAAAGEPSLIFFWKDRRRNTNQHPILNGLGSIFGPSWGSLRAV